MGPAEPEGQNWDAACEGVLEGVVHLLAKAEQLHVIICLTETAKQFLVCSS